MKKILFILVCFFWFPSSGWALRINCPEVASAGEIITCSIEENDYIGIKGKYGVEAELSYVEFQTNSVWKKYYAESNGFSVGNVKEKSAFTGSVYFKVGMNAVVGKSYLVRLLNVEGVNDTYENVDLGEVVSNSILIVSDISTLKSLMISKGTLSPKFSPDVTSYQATVDESSIVISANATDERSKLEGDIGEKQLHYGVNTFRIKVTSERGSIREYQLYITRKMKSKDASLSSLNINGKKISLEKDKFFYELEVEHSVKNLEIEAMANQKQAKVEIDEPDELVDGENKVTIKVIAEDGTECQYVVAVNRKKVLSSENRILSLLIEGYDLAFDKDVLNYSLTIENEDKLEIKVILMDELSSYQVIGNKNLKDGSKIKIVVKASDGTERTYTIQIVQDKDGNSSSLTSGVKMIPLLIFVVLVLGILIVKICKSKIKKSS